MLPTSLAVARRFALAVRLIGVLAVLAFVHAQIGDSDFVGRSSSPAVSSGHGQDLISVRSDWQAYRPPTDASRNNTVPKPDGWGGFAAAAVARSGPDLPILGGIVLLPLPSYPERSGRKTSPFSARAPPLAA